MSTSPTGLPLSKKLLDELQKETFDYFLYESNQKNGLIADRTLPGAPASIAAVGLALSAYPVGVERGFLSRSDACSRTLTTLKFFFESEQSKKSDATGYKGFFYHFLDMKTGQRVWKSELSTIDSALLLAGMLTAKEYFTEDNKDEGEIRQLADLLYQRADWNWARNGGSTVTHGWKPERGFIKYRWEGYDEALILYILGLGSPTFPLPEESYAAWCSTYEWKKIYGIEFFYAGPLFIHQLSHLWIDFRGIQDLEMQKAGIDYFENSRRATQIQREYGIENPLGFKGYSKNCWGVTASDGPGNVTKIVDGKKRKFYNYLSRGAPFGPDDGTISPWAAITSLPFAPEIVLPALKYFHEIDLKMENSYGFKASFNPTFPTETKEPHGWVSPHHLGLNQGPIVIMIENYRSDLVWSLIRRSSYITTGLKRAGFKNGWL